MKPVFLLLFLWFGLVLPVQAQLNGTYTIGGLGPNYSTLSAAVAALNTVGTSGPVVFRIRGGTYDEQVTIANFTRTGSFDDEVAFVRDQIMPVTWQYSLAGAGNDWVVKLDGAQSIRFAGLDFVATAPDPRGRLLYSINNPGFITVRNCTFTGHQGGSRSLVEQDASSLGDNTDFTFQDNTFTNGLMGIDWDTFSGIYAVNMQVLGNTFSGQTDYGINIAFGKNVLVDSNYVSSASWSDSGYSGIRVGLYNGGPTTQITQNTVDMLVGSRGIWTFGTGPLPNAYLIANNLVSIRDATNGDQAIYIGDDNVALYHNTLRTTGPQEALYVSDTTTGHTIKNNIFVAEGGGEAMNIGEHQTYNADYNNFYTTGPTLVRADGINYASLAAYQNGDIGPDDNHSVSIPVTFANLGGPNALHLGPPSNNDADLLAPALAGFETDADGDPRSIYHVYKGADEGLQILPLDNADTASGFYTVGGTSPDYAEPNAAIFNLNQRGAKGEVTFRIRAGTYDVHATLDFTRFATSEAQAKAGGDPPVKFRSANPSIPPRLQYAASGTSDNWVIKLVDVQGVIFQNLEFLAFGTAPYGRILWYQGISIGIDNNTITGCTFVGLPGVTDMAAVLVESADFTVDGQDDLVIEHTTFTDGSYGISLTETLFGSGTQIMGNTFTGQATRALSLNHRSYDIVNNTITSGRENVTALHLDGASGNANIVGNQIDLDNTGTTGIHVDFSAPTIVNNMINVRGIGLRIDDPTAGARVYHNTIRSTDFTVYLIDGAPSATTLINNILVNTSTGPALYVAQGADVTMTDYNVLTHDGVGILVHWNGANYLGLTAYRNATGMDVHSVGISVNFVDPPNGDLHLTGTSIGNANLAGTPLVGITDDIDGDARSTAAPYKGADEAGTLLGFTLTLDVLLDGPYNTGTPGTLNTGLNDNDLIPFDQPYSTAPWNYAGTEMTSSTFLANNTDVVDWVYLQILSGDPLNPPMVVEGEAAALIRDTGRVIAAAIGFSTTDEIGFAVAPGLYYVAVRHRNHLSVMSAAPVDFSSGTAPYDFTDALAKAYTGGGMAQRDRTDGHFTMWGGDGDANDSTTAFDFLNAWLPINGGPLSYNAGDFDMNGSGTAFDFLLIWLPANGQASQVPD